MGRRKKLKVRRPVTAAYSVPPTAPCEEFPDEITTVGYRPGGFHRQPLPMPIPEWYSGDEVTMVIDLSELAAQSIAEAVAEVTAEDYVIEVEEAA